MALVLPPTSDANPRLSQEASPSIVSIGNTQKRDVLKKGEMLSEEERRYASYLLQLRDDLDRTEARLWDRLLPAFLCVGGAPFLYAFLGTGAPSEVILTLGAIVILPAGKIARGKLAQAVIHGAEIVAIDGNFDDALALVLELTSTHDVALVNSINPYRIEGQQSAAWEISATLGDAPTVHRI